MHPEFDPNRPFHVYAISRSDGTPFRQEEFPIWVKLNIYGTLKWTRPGRSSRQTEKNKASWTQGKGAGPFPIFRNLQGTAGDAEETRFDPNAATGFGTGAPDRSSHEPRKNGDNRAFLSNQAAIENTISTDFWRYWTRGNQPKPPTKIRMGKHKFAVNHSNDVALSLRWSASGIWTRTRNWPDST